LRDGFTTDSNLIIDATSPSSAGRNEAIRALVGW
jgi:hypothetical protein